MTRQLRLFLVALQFYSRVPVTGRLARWVGWNPALLGPATRYFPLVGALLALIQGLVFVLASLTLPHPVAVLLAMVVGLMLTGAFHEDGWADFCDAFGGAADRERTLEIMRDSRIGAYGALGVLMLLLLRFETLAHIDSGWIVAALVCAAAFSRGCAVLLMIGLPYAREEDDQAKARPVARELGAIDAVVALALSLLPVLVLMIWTGDGTPGGLAVALALIGTMVVRRLVRRRLGAYTGDCLGAVQQVAETAFFLGMLIVLGSVVDETLVAPTP